jgi:hypothetical protein
VTGFRWRGRAWALGTLLVTAVPSTTAFWFDGVPFSTAHEYVVLLLLVLALLNRHVAWVTGRILHRLPARVMLVSLVVAAAAKVLLLVWGGDIAFPATYTSADPRTGSDVRAVSYENVFGRHDATRFDRTIDFRPDTWNLVFFNTLRFAGSADAPARDRFPLRVSWQLTVDMPAEWVLSAEYLGTVWVTVDGQPSRLPSFLDGPGVATMAKGAGRRSLVVS